MSCRKTHRSPFSQVTAAKEVFAWIDDLSGFTGEIYGTPYEPEPTFEPEPGVVEEEESELEALEHHCQISECRLKVTGVPIRTPTCVLLLILHPTRLLHRPKQRQPRPEQSIATSSAGEGASESCHLYRYLVCRSSP